MLVGEGGMLVEGCWWDGGADRRLGLKANSQWFC